MNCGHFPAFLVNHPTEPFMFLREIILGSDRGQPPRAEREILLGDIYIYIYIFLKGLMGCNPFCMLGLDVNFKTS